LPLFTFHEGEYFGEIEIIDNINRITFAKANKGTTLLYIKKPIILKLL
jgi:CRP-like cAMP-binding protein